jgi:hypothetical protein
MAATSRWAVEAVATKAARREACAPFPTPLEPALVLPSQFHGVPGAVDSAERGLLWAILRTGIEDYCREVLRGGRSLALIETERWIFRPDSDAITSFSNLCELFAIDARRLRRGLRRLREEPDRQVLQRMGLRAA